MNIHDIQSLPFIPSIAQRLDRGVLVLLVCTALALPLSVEPKPKAKDGEFESASP